MRKIFFAAVTLLTIGLYACSQSDEKKVDKHTEEYICQRIDTIYKTVGKSVYDSEGREIDYIFNSFNRDSGIGAGLMQELCQLVHYELVYSNYSLAEIGNGITIPMMEYLDRILTVGASGAVYGILLGYGMTFPDNQLFIIPFPFPIKAKWLVIGYVVLELGLGIRGNAADNVAHFAHLGGMLTGFLMILYWRHKERRNRDNHIKFTW